MENNKTPIWKRLAFVGIIIVATILVTYSIFTWGQIPHEVII